VRRALAALPRPQRRAALLRFHGELPFQIVAARLGTEEVTARTRVQRALDSLRARLGSLRAFFVIPGAQAAVLAITVVAVELPATPSPLAMATSEDVVSVQRPRHPRPVRHIATAPTAPAATKPAVKPQPAKVQVAKAPAKPSYSAVQRINFEDETLLGDVEGPDGLNYTALPRITHSSLIEIRQHFVPEMVKSLEEY